MYNETQSVSTMHLYEVDDDAEERMAYNNRNSVPCWFVDDPHLHRDYHSTDMLQYTFNHMLNF